MFKRKAFVAPRPVAGSAAGQGEAAAGAQIGRTQLNGAPGKQTIAASCSPRYFKVLYCSLAIYLKKKKSASKSFTDGILEWTDGYGHLFNENGKSMWQGKIKQVSGPGADPTAREAFNRKRRSFFQASGKQKHSESSDEADMDLEETVFELNSLVAEVDHEFEQDAFKSGACFLKKGELAVMPPKSLLQDISNQPSRAVLSSGLPSSGSSLGHKSTRLPLHDPLQAGAIVLNEDLWAQGAGRLKDGRAVVPVVVDPFLSRKLRPHQAEGVLFMYKSLISSACSGLQASGCILADEMGLGKTLQVITLIWTLLRQSSTGAHSIAKAIVVAPATLVRNWCKEFQKWLGSERLQAMELSQGPNAAQVVSDFVHVSSYTTAGVLVTSYETIRKFSKDLQGSCDLLVCDEAHRLKSQKNKTSEALNSLGCRMKVLLTGTPVQNNLEEFYALLSFVAPGVLGEPGLFKRVFADPISRGRDRDASADERQLGESRSKELSSKVSSLVLRRTQDVLQKHLPPLTQWVLFCSPSSVQLKLYNALVKKACTGFAAAEDQSLALICALRKVCNSPALVLAATGQATSGEGDGLQAASDSRQVAALLAGLPALDCGEAADVGSSGKLACLQQLLGSILRSGERCVVVSTSTAALDLIDESVCRPAGCLSVRIDGSTNVNDRQTIVDNFNQWGVGQVLLLSTRAGGAGLNLIGANNLILFDSDWNPACDLQAMARIWRDGQVRPCQVYRLLTTGSIEEKVYQRQIMKTDLAAVTVDGGATRPEDAASAGASALPPGSAGRQFTRHDLKQLFAPMAEFARGSCETRELLQRSGQHSKLEWVTADQAQQLGLSLLAGALEPTGPLTAACKVQQREAAAAGDGNGVGVIDHDGEGTSRSP